MFRAVETVKDEEIVETGLGRLGFLSAHTTRGGARRLGVASHSSGFLSVGSQQRTAARALEHTAAKSSSARFGTYCVSVGRCWTAYCGWSHDSRMAVFLRIPTSRSMFPPLSGDG